MPEMLDKETMDFLTRFFGGSLAVLEQVAFAWWYQQHPEARGQFPFTRPADKLPMWNDIIVGGISIGEVLVALGIEEFGDPTTKAQLKEFTHLLKEIGEGGVLYSVPMLAKTTIVENIPMGTAGAGRGPSPGPSSVSRGRVINL